MIQLAIIGCGNWGLNFVRNFSQTQEVNRIYICDINENRLEYIKALYHKVECIKDYNKIFHDENINSVVISTPSYTHYQLTKKALLSNKDVLVEKPIAFFATQAKELQQIAKRKKRILMVGHTFLFNQGIIKLKELIKRGKIGNVYYLHAIRTNLGPIRDDTNALGDLAPHDISIFLYLIGKLPEEVFATGSCYTKKGREDVCSGTLYFKNGIIAQFHVSWLEPCKIRKITVIGSKKMVIFDDINTLETIKIYNKGVIKEKRYETFGEFQLVLRDGDVTIPKINLTEPLKTECEHFIHCIKTRQRPITDGINGLNVVKVLEACQKSLKERQIVRVEKN